MYREQFVYCDANVLSQTFKTKWHRLKATDAAFYLNLQEQAAQAHGEPGAHKFTSVTFHVEPTRKEGEEAWGPVYFDFDDATNPDLSRQDALKLVNHLSALGVPQAAVSIAYSGKKGFHLLVEPEVFALKPHRFHTKLVGMIAKQLKHQLGLATLDEAVYSQGRLWRFLNSKHLGSGLYKIPLYPAELLLPMDQIKALATQPRLDFEREESQLSPILEELYTTALDQFANYQAIELARPKRPMAVVDKAKPGPVCIRNLLLENIRIKGTGNKARLNLACYYKDAGYTREEAMAIIEDFAAKQPLELSNDDLAGRLANVKSVVNTVYDHPEKYHFNCGFCRSLGNGSDKPIPCEHDRCEYVKQQDQEPAGLLELNTDQINRAEFTGKRFQSRAQIAGVRDVPFIAPSKFNVVCTPNQKEGSPCLHCSVFQDQLERKNNEGVSRLEKSISAKDPTFLAICNQTEKTVRQVLRRMCGIPESCGRHRFDPIERLNIYETELTPPVDLTNVDTDHTRLYSYVITPKITLQENSIIQGYTHPHPKTGKATQIIDTMVPDKQAFVADFTQEEINALRTFQGHPFSKIPEIVKDWADNILWVWDRDDVVVAVGLVLHSALFFSFQQGVVDRGWLEAAIVGDSGQAKTKVVKGLFDHFRIGKIIGCGTVSEAGLIGGVKDMAGGHSFLNWGDLPRMDKSIVALDESQEMAETIINKLKEIRDTGVASITKIESGRRMARVRQLYLANPKRSMSQYYYGCEALKDVFKRPADLRRLDFAMTVCREEIESGVYNKEHKSVGDPKYTSGLCNLLIRWIYTRRADQIYLSEEVQNVILKHADQLAGRYGADIQLCEASDLRFKLARMSVAVAGWLFSSKDGQKLEIGIEHVEYAVDFLNRLYGKKYMALDTYALAYRKNIQLDPAQRSQIDGFFATDLEDHMVSAMVKMSSTSRYFTLTDLCEQLDIDKNQGRSIINKLVKHGLAVKKQSSYENTPVGIEYLKEWENNHGTVAGPEKNVDFDAIVEGRNAKRGQGGAGEQDNGQSDGEPSGELSGGDDILPFTDPE